MPPRPPPDRGGKLGDLPPLTPSVEAVLRAAFERAKAEDRLDDAKAIKAELDVRGAPDERTNVLPFSRAKKR